MGSLLITRTCLMNKKALQILFIAFALLAFAAMVYHIICAIEPFDSTSAWRHSLFIGINIICMYGLLQRPVWFTWFWALLTVQQLYSHGSHFVRLLSENKFILIDFGVLVLMPVIFILLLINKKSTHNT
jgi:hypothetical protein